MRRLSGLVLLIALVAAGCAGGGDPLSDDLGEDVFGGIGAASADIDPGDQGSSDGGTLEDPTPEANGPLPADSIRIGNEVFERTIPADGQCFTQEDDGTIPDSGVVGGSLNNDPEFSFNVRHGQDGSLEAEVRSNLMDWISGVKDGTELTVDLDFETSSISGEGLFYNVHTNEWAYGSFTFTCLGDE